MTLPLSFALGLLLLFSAEFFDDSLPGPLPMSTLLPALLFAPLPVLVTSFVYRVRRSVGLVSGKLLLIQTCSVPAAYALFLAPGQLPSRAVAVADGLHTVELLVLLLPLLALETSVLVAERTLWSRLPLVYRGAILTPYLTRTRIPMMLLLITVSLALTLAMDLAGLSRTLEVLIGATHLGGLLGFLVFLGVMGVLLPLAFRVFLPLSRTVPPSLLATARQLGFSPKSVFVLHTDFRDINAAMVSLLPWPRYLILTDGLLRVMDERALQGVLAHEVAHARARHPLLLLSTFVLLPILLVSAAVAMDLVEDQPVLAGVAGVAGTVLAFFVLRRLSHRFEHEADQLSAEALGGPEPCLLALSRVAELPGGGQQDGSLRHPGERSRIRHLLDCATDANYLGRFHARGRQLRAAIVAGLVLATVLCGLAQWHRYAFDRPVVLLYTGQFADAATAAARLDASNLSESQQLLLQELKAEIRAVREFAPDGGRWQDIRDPIAIWAERRGRELVIEGRTKAARPYLFWGLQSDSDAVARSLAYYAQAVNDSDAAAAKRLRRHLLETLQVEGALRAALLSQ